MIRRLAAFGSFLLACAAGAADLAVLPVGLALGPGHDRGAISVTNRGREAVILQADTVSWTQVKGEDLYEPTAELLVNPPLFSVPPGQTQIVRVGLRNAPDGSRESAYRLLLREVPPAAPMATPPVAPTAEVVRVLLQLRLPVYVGPSAVVRHVEWRGRRDSDGSIAIDADNAGNVHLVVAGLALRPADAAEGSPPAAVLTTSTAILPAQRHSWRIRPERPLPANVVLEVTTDQGIQRVPLVLDGR
ncbi:MAG: fimbria/pilus periplasmic chaperone [Rhodocyclaceae bacterium]|nr:fimbria/pilus periplasmic chaperone [Rhodocyclaceae bacterium]